MKIKPGDFILNQNIKPGDIDYKHAEELAQQIHSIALLSEKCFTIFDYYKNEYFYISQNTNFLRSGNAYQKQSYQFLISNSDEEDIVLMHCIQQRAFQFLSAIEAKERTKYVFSVYVRIICNGANIDTNYRVMPKVLDKKGNIWLSVAMLDKAEKYIKPHVENLETGDLHYFEPMKPTDLKSYTKPLSKQEHLVLKYMAEGIETEKLCKKLKIAGATYKRHRRGIYKKLGTDTKLSAINRAFVYGIIN